LYYSAADFESRLQELLRYATLWKAIILIDEVDVFLERRDNKAGTDTTRNALVAVFLRQLEYFSGIVFLTTNRISSLDEAMESRIHLSISFGPPDVEVRRRIWQQILDSVPPDETELVGKSPAQHLMQYDLNGRQISNALNTAKTLARFEKSKLKLSHVETVLKVRQSFRLRLTSDEASKICNI
jgi:SpoVK/Ycf46/Vps4 family AAA+-type ATPase